LAGYGSRRAPFASPGAVSGAADARDATRPVRPLPLATRPRGLRIPVAISQR